MGWETTSLSLDAKGWELSLNQSNLESTLTMYFDPESMNHETGDEVTLSVDSVVVWGGYVHNKGEFQEDGSVKVEAWGYVSEIIDQTVDIDRTDVTPETILGDVFSGTGYILSTPVATGLVISKYEFTGKKGNVIAEMMDYSGYTFRIDYATKTVYFEEEGRVSSGLSFDANASSGGVVIKRWELEDISRVINKVYVIGAGYNVDNEAVTYQGNASDSASIGLYGKKAYTIKVDYLSSDAEATSVAGKLLRAEPGGGGIVHMDWEERADNDILINKMVHLSDTVRGIDGDFVVLEQIVSSSGTCDLTISWDRSEGFNQAIRESNEIGIERMKVSGSMGVGGTGDVSGSSDGEEISTEGTVGDAYLSTDGYIGDATLGANGYVEDAYLTNPGTVSDAQLALSGSVDDDQQNVSIDNWYNSYTTITGTSWQDIISFTWPSDYSFVYFISNCFLYVDSTTAYPYFFWRLYNTSSGKYYPSSGYVIGNYIYHGCDENDEQSNVTLIGIIADSSWDGDTVKLQMRCYGSSDSFIIDVSPQLNKIPHHTHPVSGAEVSPEFHGYGTSAYDHIPSISTSPSWHGNGTSSSDHEPHITPNPEEHGVTEHLPYINTDPDYHGEGTGVSDHEPDITPDPNPHGHTIDIEDAVEFEVTVDKVTSAIRGLLNL